MNLLDDSRWTLRRLLGLASTLTCLPLGLFAFYLAWQAAQEADRFAQAPPLPSDRASASGAMRTNGSYYRLTGIVTNGLLSPPEWPEAAAAFGYRVERETFGEDTWKVVELVAAARAEQVEIDGVPVQLGPFGRLVFTPDIALRPRSPTERWRITTKKVASHDQVTAFGVYQHGHLVDSAYDRVTIIRSDEFDNFLEQSKADGRRKALILGALGFAAALLAAVAGVSIFRSRHANAVAHEARDAPK